jgi:hypothetical protein
MSRIRTVKPELFKHLALFEAEEKYQLPLRIAFVGLFTCCDRQGRFLWQPRRLKVDILPYDNVNMDDVLNALIESGFINAYEVNNIVYGCIPTWGSHQVPNNKEHESKLPEITQGKILKGPITQSMLKVHTQLSEKNFLRINKANDDSSILNEIEEPESDEKMDFFEENSEETKVDLFESSLNSSENPHESIRVPHANFTREALNGRERKGKERNNTRLIKKPKHCPVAQEDVLKIFVYWQQTMQHPQAKLDSSREKWIREALRMGYSVDDCCQAITGCSLTDHNMGKNDKGERYDGFHIIFKSADQIDRFMQNAISPPKPQGKSEQRLQHNAQAAQAWLKAQPLETGV